MSLTPDAPPVTLDTLLAALLAADDSAKAELAARVRGDLDAAERAAFDREGHALTVERIQHDMACWFLTAARYAGRLFPGSLSGHLDPVFRDELDHTQAAVVVAEN